MSAGINELIGLAVVMAISSGGLWKLIAWAWGCWSSLRRRVTEIERNMIVRTEANQYRAEIMAAITEVDGRIYDLVSERWDRWQEETHGGTDPPKNYRRR